VRETIQAWIKENKLVASAFAAFLAAIIYSVTGIQVDINPEPTQEVTAPTTPVAD